MKKQVLLAALAVLAIIVAGCSGAKTSTGAASLGSATIYKTMSCGCCGIYAQYLKKEKFDLTVNDVVDLDATKEMFSIPANMQSCHTTKIGDYFVEGHVPMEAINKLLEEKPDIDGIAMPGMPSGSPGMPGSKEGKFRIYAIKDGQSELFMEV